MKKLAIILSLVLISVSMFGQAFIWAKQFGGASDERSRFITVDNAGNVYTTGRLEGTADFDPGTGVSNLTSAGDFDVFITKLDTSGNLTWAKRIGGPQDDHCHSLVVDTLENVYAFGRFSGTADFDPGTGIFNLTSAGSADVFIIKLGALGDLIWAKRLGGSSGDFNANSMAVEVNQTINFKLYFKPKTNFALPWKKPTSLIM